MSTRANIIIKDEYSSLIFYRHSDGYPKGTLPTLNAFLELVKSGKIRDNVSQAAGWLIIIGHEEYGVRCSYEIAKDESEWKVGAYEPTTEIHGDIEYLYTVDLVKKTITYKEV
jgi:hypothetical protein